MTGKPTYEEMEQRVRELEQAESERKDAEQNKREQNYLIDMITTTSPVAITVVNAEGRITFANPAAEATLDLTKDDIKERTYNDSEWRICGYHGEHFPEEELPFNVVRRTGMPVHDVEHAIQHPDGRRILLSINAAPLMDASGKFDGMVAALMDITERKQAEAKLANSHQRLEFALQGAELGTWDWNPQDGAVIYSDIWAQMLEYRPEEVESTVEFFKRHIHPDDLAAVLDRLTGHVEGRLPVYESEHRMRTKSGRFLWVMDRGRIVERDKDGSPVRVTGIIADITERKQAEEALRERIKEMNAFYHLSSLVEKPTMVLDELYQEMANVLPQSWQYPEVTCARIVISDREFRSSNFAESRWHQTEIIRVNGSDVGRIDVGYIEEKPEQDEGPFLKEERMLIHAIAERIGHITERKQAEISLRESEEKFRGFNEQSFVGFYIIQDGLFKYVNPKFADIFGCSVDECLDNMHFRQFVHPEDLATVEEQIRRRLAGETKTVQYTFRGIRKTGEIIHVMVFGSSLVFQGMPAAIGTMLDITRELELEAQLRQSHKMEAVGTLAGGIAHDFNNILSIIVGNAELAMLDVPEWSPAQDNLKEVREATLRARELVKQILLFARQKEHTVSNIRLEPIAKESLKMLRASIPTTVEIREDIEEGLPSVLADPSQIQQIIMNLCTNAAQVMEAEGGTLTVRLNSAVLEAPLPTLVDVLTPGRYVRMQVGDTGLGIPVENLERIFDPFFTTKGVGEGTGLGLAVVYGIVQDRNGGITVESEEGQGTIFTVYLPASDVNSVEAKTEQKRELPRGNERVLFVDDEPMIMKLGQRMLEKQGYIVQTRASGTDALECFKQDPHGFDLVVTDMTMPGMRGDRLAEEIMAIRPDIPVILSTGYSKLISKEKAREMGIRAFVMKPLTQHDLANTVREVLDEKPRK